MITSLYYRRHFDTINRVEKVQNQISGCFEILSFSNGYRTKHFKQDETTLLQRSISQGILICLWRLQVYVKDDIWYTKYNTNESLNSDFEMF